ncbi:MAG: DNA recombination protein RmuC [Candidatus Marinamargulisbacteria bacterium]
MSYFLIGFFAGGLIIGTVVYLFQKTRSSDIQSMQATFDQLSQQSLQKTQDQFFQLANERFKGQAEQHNQGLDHKKALIDQTLVTVKKEIEQVKSGLQTIESNHQKRFGEMAGYLQQHRQTTQQLMQTTTDLKEALANSKTRGQWGERMAEDVLRFSGFVEGINYVKQTAQHDGIPDFTFFLPKDKKVNMDVKFPLNNYISYLNDDNETSRETAKKQFIKDVRHHIKTITSRSYISNETVDYVMIFIPNEQIYQFMHDNDPELIDFSLQQKVVLCSPITLYAMLAVMRQAVDHFAIENKAKEMMAILANFQDQWDKYKVSMEKIGKRLADAQKEYDHLISTRTNQLDRPLKKMDELKSDGMLSTAQNS